MLKLSEFPLIIKPHSLLKSREKAESKQQTANRTEGSDEPVGRQVPGLRRHSAARVYLEHVMFWSHQAEISQYGTGEGTAAGGGGGCIYDCV